MARRLRPGDVLEVEFPKVPSPEIAFPEGGYGYLMYVGNYQDYGEATRIRPGVLYERPSITEDLFADSYITFYPANLAIKFKLATVVGHLEPVPMPTVFRRPGMIERGGKVKSWLIDDENGTTVTTTLTEDQKKINIASVWNHESLLFHISKGWRPEQAVESMAVK